MSARVCSIEPACVMLPFGQIEAGVQVVGLATVVTEDGRRVLCVQTVAGAYIALNGVKLATGARGDDSQRVTLAAAGGSL